MHADGFINWSKLPASPALQLGQTGSITQVIPVTGIPNLTATVTIQGTPYYSYTNPSPIYTVVNSSDLRLSLVPNANPNPITITFSSPVRGVAVMFRASGDGIHKFRMIADDTNGNPIDGTGPYYPADLQLNALQEGHVPVYTTANMQIHTTINNINAVLFSFTADEVYSFETELINLRVESGLQPDLALKVPTNGLKAWYRADEFANNPLPAVENPLPFTIWNDQSGNGNNATIATQAPYPTISGQNCSQVLSFNGGQSLKFNLPISGWSGMTTVMATQSYVDGSGSTNAALYWGPSGWGETFVSPFQTSVWYRFGTSHPGIVPVYKQPVTNGGDFTITTTMHSPSTDSLYVNGVLAYQLGAESSTIQGSSATGIIGGGHGGSFFTGNIGEILIYDRALSDTEREQVEQYLRTKYLY
jgi:Concanavalin A-like lectin/glucanases superfamily